MKMTVKAFFLFLLLVNTCHVFGQAKIEAYAYTADAKIYLSEVEATLLDGDREIAKTLSDINGWFEFDVAPNKSYAIGIKKPGFQYELLNVRTNDATTFVNVPLTRKPGYLFEATISEELLSLEDGEKANAVDHPKLEVYNVTADSIERVEDPLDGHAFSYLLQPGHQYIMLLRKEGYFAKEIIANVDVHGCILCVDGVGDLNPGVADNLTENNTAGTLSANIQMKKIEIDESMEIENIYYEYNKANITPIAKEQLGKVVKLMRHNPDIIIELGSHTDARGKDKYNQRLSQKRAENAVSYIVSRGIDRYRITAKGYGENVIINHCANNVECTDEEHQENRRTEVTVLGFTERTKAMKSLVQMIEERKFEELVDEVTKGGVVSVGKVAGTTEDVELGGGFGSGVVEIPADYKPKGTETDVDSDATEPTAEELATAPQGEVVVPSIKEETIDEVLDIEEIKPFVVPVDQRYKAELIQGSPVPVRAIGYEYTGYAIELLVAKKYLPSWTPMYAEYPGVLKLDKDDTGYYSYLIDGFEEKQDAVNYIYLKGVKASYPTSNVVYYENGLRK